ncbi:MAG: hypothetical protein ACE5DO_13850 [Desulfobacterales bacterium]
MSDDKVNIRTGMPIPIVVVATAGIIFAILFMPDIFAKHRFCYEVQDGYRQVCFETEEICAKEEVTEKGGVSLSCYSR